MWKFNHPNVMTLTGICIDGGPTPYIVMPFMDNGSLLSYLKKERSNFILPAHADNDLVRLFLRFWVKTCITFCELATAYLVHHY